MNIAISTRWSKVKAGEDDGAGLAEYALLLFVVAVAAATMIGDFGDDIIAAFQGAIDALPSSSTTP